MKRQDIVFEDIKGIAKAIKREAKKLEGKIVLISGGAGFIGSYLIATIGYLNETLLLRKCKVLSIDNYITGSPKGLIPIRPSRHIVHIRHNVIRPFKTTIPIDYIIHAAGIASPVYYRQSPLETIDVTIHGVRHLLELARKKKVKSFLYFSSSEIYGDPHHRFIPTPETYRGNVSSIGDRSVYDESKRLGETIAMAYYNLYKLLCCQIYLMSFCFCYYKTVFLRTRCERGLNVVYIKYTTYVYTSNVYYLNISVMKDIF